MRKSSPSTWIVGGLLFAAAVVLGLIAVALIGFDVGLEGFLIGSLMAAVPVPFYIAFALWIDRFEEEPRWMLTLAFVWGAAIAVFFSLIVNVINQELFTSAVGAEFGAAMTAVVSAPFIEELTKGAALLLFFLWRRDEFDNVTDGIVYASMIGLGFAMTENIQYYGRAVAAPEGGATVVFFVRGIMGPFAHPLFTSMTGIGLGMARESDRKSTKFFAPLIGLSAAMFLHAAWNLSTHFGLAFFATYLVIMVPAFIGVIVVGVFSLRREANIIRTHLACLVAEGVLSGEDLLAVTSVRRRVGAASSALFTRGFPGWIARRRFHALTTELAFHSWRCSREWNADADAIRADLVREIRATREKLGLPPDVRPPAPELVRRLTREVPLPAAVPYGEQRSSLSS
jgi:RsiW-degrading membrane proteinase PrsW (M82 family)